MSDMTRREFAALVGGAGLLLAVKVRRARAQQAMPVVGFLSNTSRQLDDALRLAPFREGLKETGYVEGRNVAAEFRGAANQLDRLPVLAADLLHRQPAVIVTLGGPASAVAAKAASATVPIAFTIAGDPVELGLVASFNRPGGNVTGVATSLGPLVAKQFEALNETVPTATVIGYLLNPSNPNTETYTSEAEKATRALGLKREALHARNETEIEMAFATLVQKRVSALVVVSDGLFNGRREQITALAARYTMPAIYPFSEYARAGGLMSYGTRITDSYHQVGVYTGRILRGARPADLPVVQSTKFEFVLNLTTAKALGLEVPPTLLARADEVIE
jgi:putative ABC transport system substrate-binding protein